MSESVGNIALDLEVNQSGFNSQVNSIGRNAESMLEGTFLKLGKVIAAAFAVDKLIGFGKSSVELASNLNEVQNVVDTTFGSMKDQINDFSKTTITTLGMSELSAKRYASTMGAMLKSSGISGQPLADMSKKIVDLTGGMASFYNLQQDDAFQKIRAGISGETEPLKQLGVNMSTANLQAFALKEGIKGTYQNMDQAHQSLLRYNYLMSVTKDAQGDFTKTAHSWANEVRVMGEQWNVFKTTMGQGFINMLTPVLTGLNVLISKLQVAAQYFKAFTEMVFGVQTAAASTSGTDAQTAASDALGNSIAKTNAAVKDSTQGFDKLNVIGQSKAGAGTGSGAISGTATPSTPSIDASTLSPIKTALDTIKSTAESLTKYFQSEFGPVIKLAVGEISPVIDKWKDSLLKAFSDVSKLGTPLKTWFTGDLIPAIKVYIADIGHVFAGLLDSALSVFNGLETDIMPIISKLATSTLPVLTQMATGWMDCFRNWFDYAKHVFDTLWSGAIQPGLQLASKMVVDTLDIFANMWNKYGLKIIGGVQDVFINLTKIFDDLWKVSLKPIVDDMLTQMSSLWDKHLKGVVQAVSDFVGALVTDALEIYNKFILPLIDYLIKNLGPAFSQAVQLIIDVVGTIVGYVADVAKGVIEAFTGIMDFITGVFTLNWEKAWTGVKEIFTGIFDMMLAGVKGTMNLIIDAINVVIRALDTIKFSLPSWIPGVGGQSFGINIPTVPHLANGGLVSAPTLALVGDNRGAASDPEVVSPLSKLKAMMGGGNEEMLRVLLMILQAIQNQDSNVYIDGEKLSKIVRTNMIKEDNRVGKRTVTVGGNFV